MTTPRRSVQDQFGQLAAQYGASRTHLDRGSLVSLGDYVGGRRYHVAVDIGAGPGFTAFAIAPFADRVVATDVTPQMLGQARSLREQHGAPDTELALVGAEALPFRNASIDLVATRTASHHFSDLGGWLRESARVLTPGGVLAVTDTIAPDNDEANAWQHDVEMLRDPSHGRNITVAQWRAAVEGAGLRITFTEASVVKLEFPDWGERAGLSGAPLEELGRILRDAPPAARDAFGIEPQADGTVLFYWGVLTLLAEKPA